MQGQRFGETPLHIVSNKEVAKLLIDRGADVNAKDYQFKMTPIFSQNVETSKLLLEAGADINTKSKDGNTPIIWYSNSNYIEGIEFLIEAGADVAGKNKKRKDTSSHSCQLELQQSC